MIYVSLPAGWQYCQLYPIKEVPLGVGMVAIFCFCATQSYTLCVIVGLDVFMHAYKKKQAS